MAKCSPGQSWTRQIVTATASDDKVRIEGLSVERWNWSEIRKELDHD
jgi:hypothetical protein